MTVATAPATFTDDSLTPASTVIKAMHVNTKENAKAGHLLTLLTRSSRFEAVSD